MKKVVTFTILMVFMFPMASMAQNQWGFNPGDWTLSITGSGTSDDDIDNTIFSIEGSVGYFFTKSVELGLRQGLGIIDREGGEDTWDASTRVYLDYTFDLDRLQPFVGANLGYLYGDDDVIEDTAFVGPEAGLRYFVMQDAYLYGLVEFNYPFDDDDSTFEDGRFVYALGLGINW